MDLADPLKLSEPSEDQLNRFPDTQVGIHRDPIARRLHVTDGHRQEQLTASRLCLERFDRARA
jgi:hypothetical protein